MTAEPIMWRVDGHDDAIMGVAHSFGRGPVLVYSLRKIIDKLVEEGMTVEEAYEYFEYNILGSYLEGGGMPVFLSEMNYEEWLDYFHN